ncbi:MAG: hypothetical protein C5B52_04420, partial [Bacteroidetes bacterium]
DPVWQDRYQELLGINKLMKQQEVEVPSMRFTKNVMDAIASQHISKATIKYLNKKIIYGIAGFFFLLMTSLLVYVLLNADFSSSESSGSQIIKEYGSWDISKYMSKSIVQIIMFINVILGLVLLDRYLSSRKNKFHQEA